MKKEYLKQMIFRLSEEKAIAFKKKLMNERLTAQEFIENAVDIFLSKDSGKSTEDKEEEMISKIISRILKSEELREKIVSEVSKISVTGKDGDSKKVYSVSSKEVPEAIARIESGEKVTVAKLARILKKGESSVRRWRDGTAKSQPKWFFSEFEIKDKTIYKR